jgi:hypothetical protein
MSFFLSESASLKHLLRANTQIQTYFFKLTRIDQNNLASTVHSDTKISFSESTLFQVLVKGTYTNTNMLFYLLLTIIVQNTVSTMMHGDTEMSFFLSESASFKYQLWAHTQL